MTLCIKGLIIVNIFNKDNKALLKYIGILLLGVIITHRLPHDSYSLIQYIIRPIKFDNGVLYLSGIIPLMLFIISIRGIFRLKKYENKSKVGMILLILIVVMPLMNWFVDSMIGNYHWLKNDGLNTIEIEGVNSNIVTEANSVKINIEMDLIDYGRNQNEFTIRVFLPKTLVKYLGNEYYEFDEYYITHGNCNKLVIKKQITLNIDDNELIEEISDSKYYYDDMKYELYNKEESVVNIKHGM